MARFQQVNAGAGSDKLNGGTVISCDDCVPPPPPPAPPIVVSGPATLALLGLGLLGIGCARRRS